MILKNNDRRIGFNTPSPVSCFILLLFFQLILLGSISLQAAAAPQGVNGMNRQMNEVSLEKIMETLTNKLELNQGQIAEVQPIMEKFLMQSKKLKEDTIGGHNTKNPGTSKKEMVILVQKTMEQIDVFLNDEQSEKFKELVQYLTQKEGFKKLFGLQSPVAGEQLRS